jgi:hypothetical protein
MKKLFFALTLLVLPLFAMSKGIGYGNTEWGMSPDEVVTAQNGKAHLIKPDKYYNSWGKVRIDNVSIGHYLYNINFLFDASNRLTQVNVNNIDKSSGRTIQRQFDSLNQLLTQKYGEPLFKSNDAIIWQTANTTIELSKLVIDGVMAESSVTYTPNSKVINDTLNL